MNLCTVFCATVCACVRMCMHDMHVTYIFVRAVWSMFMLIVSCLPNDLVNKCILATAYLNLCQNV